MKTITIIAATAAMLLTSFAEADAQGRGRGRGGDDRRAERGYDRGGRGGYDDRGPGRGNGNGRGNGRGEGARMPRFEPDPDARRRADPRNAPPPALAVRPGQSWRQGQRLPPMYRGDVLRDPGRYRLRAAPPGYDWVGVGPDIYLVQRSTGMVLDTVPGGF
jgi:Ni/Co efflux regulator RcnB